MRKLLLPIMTLLTLVSSGQVKIAARGGLNLANMYKPGGFILRANGGMQLEFPLGDEGWFIYSGVHYSGKGARYGKTYLSTRRDSLKIRLNYIELPVYFGRQFGGYDGESWIAGGGPTIGYGFLGSKKWKGGSPPPQYNLHKKEQEWYRRMEWGFGFFLQRNIDEQWSIRSDVSGSIFHITFPYYGKDRNIVGGLSVLFHFR